MARTPTIGVNISAIKRNTNAKVLQPRFKCRSPIPMKIPRTPKFKFMCPFVASMNISMAAEMPPRMKIHDTILS